MTTDDWGRLAVAVVGVLTLLQLAPMALAQLGDAVRRQRAGDGLQRYRLATAALAAALFEIITWRETIWADVVLYAGQLLGPTMGRWRLDLPVGLTILALVTYVSVVFWSGRWSVDRAPRQADRDQREE